MADLPTREQIRGARAMLDLSTLDLARAARLSVSTVKRLQDGESGQVADEALATLQRVLETEGVRFLPDDGHGPGVRAKPR